MGLLHLDVLTVTGETLGSVLDWWEGSDRRRETRAPLAGVRRRRSGSRDHERRRRAPATASRSTVVFPVGNVAPEGSVDQGDRDRSVGRGRRRRLPASRTGARLRRRRRDAIAAIKGIGGAPVKPNDVIVLIGAGPLGTGMEETYQLTSALKYIPWGETVAIVTDARFSGVSTGACIGHVGPEALAGGPIGKLVDGDVIEIVIDRRHLNGRVNLVAAGGRELDAGARPRALLASRALHPGAARARLSLPDDTRLWAALQAGERRPVGGMRLRRRSDRRGDRRGTVGAQEPDVTARGAKRLPLVPK